MAFLSVKNNAASILAADITNVATSLTVAGGEGARFPASNFPITIEDEILLCSSRVTDTLTVVRAQEGTAAAAHATAKAVRLNITAAIVTELQDALPTKIPNSVLTERGSIIFRNATVPAELLHGTDGQVLTTKGDGADPIWAAAAGGMNIVWKATNSRSVSDLDRTVSLAWTDLDLTSVTSANAKFAILMLFFAINSITAGAANSCWMGVRKNGDTPTDFPIVAEDGAGGAAGSQRYNTLWCAMDALQIVEYAIGIGGTINVSSYLSVVGYVE